MVVIEISGKKTKDEYSQGIRVLLKSLQMLKSEPSVVFHDCTQTLEK
jgi:hypothetical protein